MTRTFRTSISSRERNRVHAQRTRLRKKEQMQGLQGRVNVLKEEQIRLKQVITEKNTANILVGLFAFKSASDAGKSIDDNCEDPRVEELLKRPADEIPDASMIPELPALILPGQHASKKLKAPLPADCDQDILGIDGIDYQLLGKDRSQCTAQELDKIRRERNRMHAKRTRDRKRIFTEKLSEMSRILQEENATLKSYLSKIDPDYSFIDNNFDNGYSTVTTEDALSCSGSDDVSPQIYSSGAGDHEMSDISLCSSFPDRGPVAYASPSKNVRASFDSLATLLTVAGCFEQESSKRPLSERYSPVVSVDTNYHTSSPIQDCGQTINSSNGNEDTSSLKRRRVSNDFSLTIVAGGC